MNVDYPRLYGLAMTLLNDHRLLQRPIAGGGGCQTGAEVIRATILYEAVFATIVRFLARAIAIANHVGCESAR